jgi:hypothetical protein
MIFGVWNARNRTIASSKHFVKMVEAPGYFQTKNYNISVIVSASSNRKTAFYRFILDESNAIICFGLY